jgi:hypothetical protein
MHLTICVLLIISCLLFSSWLTRVLVVLAIAAATPGEKQINISTLPLAITVAMVLTAIILSFIASSS